MPTRRPRSAPSRSRPSRGGSGGAGVDHATGDGNHGVDIAVCGVGAEDGGSGSNGRGIRWGSEKQSVELGRRKSSREHADLLVLRVCRSEMPEWGGIPDDDPAGEEHTVRRGPRSAWFARLPDSGGQRKAQRIRRPAGLHHVGRAADAARSNPPTYEYSSHGTEERWYLDGTGCESRRVRVRLWR